MKPSARIRVAVAWVSCGTAAVLTATAVALTVRYGSPPGGDVALDAVLGAGASALGAFVVAADARHPIGWLLLLGGLTRAVTGAAGAWSHRALVTDPGSVPGGALASWLAWTFLLSVPTAPLIVALFPDGRLSGPRWRVIPALSGIAAVLLAVVVPAGLWPYRGVRLLPESPTPDTTAAHVIEAALTAGVVLVVGATVLALASLAGRFRRSTGAVRQQVKWFALGAAAALTVNVAALAPGLSWLRVFGPLLLLAALGLGIFRFNLYGVDRLINRTLVYGLLTLTLAGAFAAVDVTLALAVGGSSAATAAGSAFVTALLLRPVRDQVQDLIDRVYDRRTHDAVRVLGRLAERVGHEEVTPAAVRDSLRRALLDPEADVYFPTGGGFVDLDGAPASPRPDRLTTQVGDGVAVVAHAGVDPRSTGPVLRAATPVLEHARLRAELSVQLAEVRASRTRLALAADAERRRIERDLHDGAQQRLVGLALHVQSARRRPAVDADLLAFVVAELRAGVEDIRALVHGILPPALTTGGLPAAIAELGRPGEVTVVCAVPARLDPDIEATAWFVACEGVTNARKHASGAPVRVDVSTVEGRLAVRVDDDGPGGADPSGDGLRYLADRVEAHAGTLHIDSPPGRGTRLVADLPCG